MNLLRIPRSPGPQTPPALRRLPALDGLRGLGLLAVIGCHTGPLFPGGAVALDMFFVLSGFLITALLLDERQARGGISLGRFYLRRALRLLPALIAVLLFAWLCAAFMGRTPGRVWALWNDELSVLFYYYNYRSAFSTAPHPAYLGHLWSLSVEEQFYLVWPTLLAVLLAFQVRRRWILAVVALGAVVPLGLRLALLHADPSEVQRVRCYVCTHTRMDAMAIGALVGLLHGWGAAPTGRGTRLVLRFAGLAAFATLAAHLFMTTTADAYMVRWGFSVVALASATLIAALAWSPPSVLGRLLEAPAFCWLGRISYGAYLWNVPVCAILEKGLGNAPWGVKLLLCAGTTLAAGALSHYCLEAPFLRLKRRLEPVRPARVAVSGVAAPLKNVA